MLNSMLQILLALLQVVFSYVNFKILLREKFKIIEFISLIVGALILANSYPFLGMYGVILMLFFLLFLGNYFVGGNFFYITGALSYSLIIMVISDHVSSVINFSFWKIADVMETNESALLHIPMSIFLSVVIVFSINKFKSIIEKKFPFINEFRTIISIIGIFMMVIYYLSIFLGKYLGNNTEIVTLNLIFFIIYFFISLFTFSMYAISMRNKYEMQQKELEYLANERYVASMENQFKEMSKFRHDYKNILTSMENFIVEKDIDGLMDYYSSVVKTSSEAIEQNSFKLEKLGNIQVRELKSILAAKLITAQEKGFDTKIEVTEVINKIKMDSVSLVRIVGIFLDNAIEELDYLGNGILSVALYQDEKAVHVIIQNSCREDMPKLYRLKTKGFSTKGENRGAGLSNVQEIVSETGNLYLSTSIADHLFTQKLVVEF